jgi:FHS family L-fucose permease-like MFS transporter
MSTETAHPHWPKLFALSTVYLIWGAIASLNDLLIPYLKAAFDLNFSSAMRIQLVFYMAYFLLSIPCGMLARRFGYRVGVLTGLGIAFFGCLSMIFASRAGSYAVVLGAMFVLASGITMLQVSANPYATSLGPQRTAPSRLTLVQSFHSLGTTIGPWFGAVLIFSVAAAWPQQYPGQAIWLPYSILAAGLALLALLFLRSDSAPSPNDDWPARLNPLALVRTNRQLLPGTLGIFCYVGAEIAIASLLVNYLVRPEITGLDYESAGKLVSVYWGCALIGRFAGIGLLRVFRPDRLLTCYAAIATLLLAITLSSSGPLAAASVLLVGFFNSIMFPTIFALTLGRSPECEAPGASGVLCLGIVGGAVVSQAQGALADEWGIQASFSLPLLCYVYIIFLSMAVLKPVTPGLQTES